MPMLMRTTTAGLCGAIALGAATVLWAPASAVAVDPRSPRSPLLDNRTRTEQDIRRNYNNYNRNLPTSPYSPSIRQEPLERGVPQAPLDTRRSNSGCAYAYSRWKRSGSSYWRERYLDCTG